MSRRVLFVERQLRTDKLGPMYLSAYLKAAGIETRLIQDLDVVAERIIAEWNPTHLAWSVQTGEHRWMLTRNRELKQKFPNLVSIAGGPHFTFFPEQGLEDPHIDYVVEGPAEYIIADLVNLGAPYEKAVEGVIPHLRSLLLPDRGLLYDAYPETFGQARMKRFIASRDCTGGCSYCFNHLYHRKFREQKARFHQRMPVARLMEEIEDVRAKWPLQLAYFNDDDLAGDAAWLEDFCAVFERTGLEFCGSVRADNANPAVLERMASAGCTFLNIAVESAVPETRRLLRRGKLTNDAVEAAVRACKRYGIKVRLQNMIGLPVKDPLEDAMATLDFNLSLKPTDSWAAIFQPFPKTDAWKFCVEHGYVTEQTDCTNFYEESVLRFSEDDFESAQIKQRLTNLHRWWFFACDRDIRDLLPILLDIAVDECAQRLQAYRWKLAAKLLYEIEP